MGQWMTYLRRKETKRISFKDLAEDLAQSRYAVALTGAGVSAESGIPTFRDPSDGLWQKYDPATYATIWGFWRCPSKIWELLNDFLREYSPEPNDTHIALSKLEAMGYLKSIITQNVDNLHQDAGSRNVIEFHGNLMRASCYSCGHKIALSKSLICNQHFAAHLPPTCPCGGIYKPDAVLFGEAIPSEMVKKANHEIDRCDLLLVIGTSATVSPASSLPYRAMSKGAKVIEVNLECTGLTDRITDKIVLGKSSSLFKTVQVLESRRHVSSEDDAMSSR